MIAVFTIHGITLWSPLPIDMSINHQNEPMKIGTVVGPAPSLLMNQLTHRESHLTECGRNENIVREIQYGDNHDRNVIIDTHCYFLGIWEFGNLLAMLDV